MVFQDEKGVNRLVTMKLEPELNCVPRTGQNFLLQIDSDHHKGVSILTKDNIAIGLVFQFVLDPMHLVYLGYMRKLLKYP